MVSANRMISLLGIPFDANSSYLRGTALAPPVIRQALFCDSSNLWSENGIHLRHLLRDEGDLEGAQSEVFNAIESKVESVLDSGNALISLGGDHSITYPVLRAFRKKYSRFGILHFDAHPDLYADFEGNPFSHASPFARILENGLADCLVQVGIRTTNQHQREQAAKYGVRMIEMKDCRNELTVDFDVPVYISFDIDGLDPAFAPGVAHPEAGGLSTRDALRVIQSLKVPVIGADIVEFNPGKDVAGITASVCAKLIKEIASLML